MPSTRGMASSGSRAKVELTTRNSLMNTPKGGRPAMAPTPITRLQPSQGCVCVRPRISTLFCVRVCQRGDIGALLRALERRNVAGGEENSGLGQAVHRHVEEAGEIRHWPAH